MKKGHKFPTSFGFAQSSGKMRGVRSYVQRVPVKKADGGCVTPSEARSVAREVVGEHVSSPRPSGHGRSK
jgi:hypothetical protein